MKRTIYNFYCYRCYKQNIAAISYPLDIHNGKINHIYCPNCRAWIPCRDTNLSAERYKLIHTNDWDIIDEDTPMRSPVYAVRAYAVARSICDALNSNTISVSELYHNMCFKF